MASARRDEQVGSDARALYERGLAESHRGVVASMQTLAAALEAARSSHDAHATALAAAALLFTGHSMGNFRRMREHADALAGVRDGSLTFADREDELVAHAGSLLAFLMLGPSDPGIDDCVERIMTLLELDLDVNTRFAAGRLVLFYANPRENRTLDQRVYGLLQPSADDADLTPHRLGRWLATWISTTANAKEPAQQRRAREQAQALVERCREPGIAICLAFDEFDAGMYGRDFTRASRALASIEAAVDSANLYDVARLAWFKGRLALAQGEGDAALSHAGRARCHAEELELPGPMLGMMLALEAQARILVRDYAGAREQLRRTSEVVAVLHADEVRDMIGMVDAFEALELVVPMRASFWRRRSQHPARASSTKPSTAIRGSARRCARWRSSTASKSSSFGGSSSSTACPHPRTREARGPGRCAFTRWAGSSFRARALRPRCTATRRRSRWSS